jgi:methionine-rich copper-binding protein CopC
MTYTKQKFFASFFQQRRVFFSEEKKKKTFTLLLIVAICVAAPLPCAAHAFLDGALPRVGSEIAAAPTKVVLHFTQGVEPDFSRIEVTDAAGAAVTDGTPHTEPGDDTRLAINLKKLAAGIYTVIWHVTSVDTHKTQGKFHFTVTQ